MVRTGYRAQFRSMSSVLKVDVPEALAPLLQPARYKAAYGGRGGAKSHFFAEQIIVRCYAVKSRVACIREVQATIKDSVRQLLIDKIQALGLGQFFDVLESEIRGRNGSLISSRGCRLTTRRTSNPLRISILLGLKKRRRFRRNR